MKQLEKKKYKIGDNTYFISPFPAMKASNLFGKIVGMLGPVASGLVPLLNEEVGDLENMNLSALAESLSMSLGKMDGDEVEDMMKTLMIKYKNVTVEYRGEDGELTQEILTEDLANEIFCMALDEMYVLAFYIVKLNFGSFFTKASDLSGKASEQIIRLTKSKNMVTST